MKSFVSKIKATLKNAVHKIKGTDPKTERKPDEILKDLEPHFIRTLTQNNTETDKMFFTELHKRLIDLADKEDVRIKQNDSHQLHNLFVPKNVTFSEKFD